MSVTPVLLITYDISDDANRLLVVEEIKKFSYVMLCKSSYAIQTDITPETVYNQFEHLVGKDDVFYVINLRKPYYGQGYGNVIDWLDANLPL